jgi:penicillin-binding protein 2
MRARLPILDIMAPSRFRPDFALRPDSPFAASARRRRAVHAVLFVAMVLVCVGAAFFRTQVLHNGEFRLRSDDNRLRVIPITAPRGAVYDRNGEMIAETITSYALYLEPMPPDSVRAAIERLRGVIELGDSAVSDVLAALENQPNQPALVARDLTFPEVSRIEERRLELGGTVLEPVPVRRYPLGEAVAHLIGYVSEITERELEDPAWSDYAMGQQVGRSGIERQYERVLGGVPGERFVEVNATGRIIRPVPAAETRQPTPGGDIHLSLDLALQRYARQIFPGDMSGAIVAIAPETGEVLALYSHPTYDPNLLVGVVTSETWATLKEDPGRPLLDRATSGIYAPGSTWKLATAIIGLETEVIEPETTMPIPCTGGMSYAGRYSRCWDREGHGSLGLAAAIANSCNVYFYQLGIWLGLERLASEGSRLGFDRETGIDLPSEAAGTFPSGSGWYEERFGWTPTPSEVMSLAIGQGPNAQTPLRMAQFFAALAGSGAAPTPRLLAGAGRPGDIETDLNLRPETLAAVRDGLAAVTEQGGTAYLSSLERWKLYGKTGTSQNSQDAERPHAWFTGFAGPRGGEPEIAVAVVVEFGQHGSSAAAPLAAKIADFYLNRKHGLAMDTTRQTLGERSGR